MRETNRILVFDIGTSAVKTALFSDTLELVALSSTEYPLYTEGVRVEADPSAYLSAMAKGVAQLSKRDGVKAICITTQGETYVPVDASGMPLTRAVVWLDARATDAAKRIGEALPCQRFYETTGLPEITGALPLAKLAAFSQTQQALYEKTDKFLLLEDYIRFVLTGRALTNDSLATSTGWLDIRTGGYWEEALAAAGVSKKKLPEIAGSGAPAGVLQNSAASLLGLQSGIPVFTGAMDQTAAALAAIAGRKNVVAETTGTAHVLAAATQSPIFPAGHHTTVYRHALPGQFLYLPIGNTAGMALKWFRREFAMPGEDFMQFDELAQKVPAGSAGVTFLPYLSGAVDPFTLPDAAACFFGLRLSTTRAHLVRALLESTGFELKQFLQQLRKLGCDTSSVVALGGGAKSAVWCGIKADIIERTIETPVLSEATAAGAALLAGWGSGLLASGEYPEALTKTAAVYEPNPEHYEACREAFSRYNALLTALLPIYRD